MSSSSGPGQSGPPRPGKAPYPPRYIGLGGSPAKIPDIPITAVFLVLYILFAVIHIMIMKYNKSRGHKFIFNGALFGFCKVRLITMVLRIAWSCYPRNISLAIAANVFVYVGTIILYLCNWFFTQRVVRAQHPRFGWSTQYRIIHRAGIVALILALFMIIVASIQQFFTLDQTILRVDRRLQLAAFTYFASFTLAPFFLLAFSFVMPRKGTEKFGAGRLRNAIAVLFFGTLILALGQCFRTIAAWLPEIPVRNARGQPNPIPWYYSRACFYCFNFLTELLVVIFYAIMRVDLRFYVPDGAKKPGDYRAWRESQYNVAVVGSEKRLKRQSGTTGSIRSVMSHETLHEYENSVFEATRTLADSLRFGPSIMETDDKTGRWKVKRQSTNGSIRSSLRPSTRSQSSLWDPTRATLIDQTAPPVPSVPQDWLLRESQLHVGQMLVLKHHRNRTSRSPNGSFCLSAEQTPDMEKADAHALAINKLEGKTTPPDYNSVAPATPKKSYQPQSPQPSADIPKKHTYTPAAGPTSDIPPKKDYRSSSPPSSDILYKNDDAPTSPTSGTGSTYTTAQSDIPPKKDCYASPEVMVPPLSPRRRASSTYSHGRPASFDTEAAEREFARLSSKAAPREGSTDEEGKSGERGL
ncbi:hypothetical protein BU23DRAFT_651014 [Bimuria novae-zelandiae CBS 107.79]|uniref:Uncharacterized protein n=1 Tax=Bimuria novae-zelandiae CBS 107.79 TaxID=1447943 RepID=A0A6A5VKV3_9PLEO|nr:hypothetical protein BU23DRAFT_651014 [Bimuria novae-zelandiae CBS 107.79]